ncbi:hypothetical protein HRR83_005767 [Exophiala dermatitidis]|uniref:Uncharacterized protein n=1 Tax=Exophiala dermatitidis (strain ATCC 34100 / CBS 525.76 / NIH/UT8656) TaxID=858893 RepID=H6BV04_EXODN|nr:uncharacterized protein HMPREF1120_03133 [Exophiala dermatitidis NIH/UT8656]KAJ4508675.1 hypothetical protein HRR73_007342 [Exophiala dermatitidis]EHY54974.1 hypothetical protein HMPREF1120_03133 [Exophiala dermatitidis NIH/UT8656]KAJ4510926.1 hypothetical protein HRR75_005620 [Exophiala dermatitidis]KAJ4513323.1 hypothetical protein HRR74_006135 [Exophiala dermatitidis]KAJ4538125.1 hypothetical protein HRR77_007165 [Exophiala dermatitidis]
MTFQMGSVGISTKVLFHDLYRVRESLQVLPTTAGEIAVIAVQIGALQEDSLEVTLCQSLETFCSSCTKEDEQRLAETVQRATLVLYTLRSLSEEAAQKTQWSDNARIQFEDSWTLLCARIEEIANMAIVDEEDRMTFLGFRGLRRNEQILVSTRSARPHRWSGDSSTKSSEQTAETLETLDDMSYDKLRQGTWAFEHSQINSSTSEAKGTSSTSLLKRALHFRLRRAPEPVEEKKDQPTPRLLVPDLTGATWKSRETVFTLPSTYDEEPVPPKPVFPAARTGPSGTPKPPNLGRNDMVSGKATDAPTRGLLAALHRASAQSSIVPGLSLNSSPLSMSTDNSTSSSSKVTAGHAHRAAQSARAETATATVKAKGKAKALSPAPSDKLNVKFERRADGKIVIDEEDAVKIQSLLDPDQLSVTGSGGARPRRPPQPSRTTTATTATSASTSTSTGATASPASPTEAPRLRGGGSNWQEKRYKRMVKSPSVLSTASTVDLVEADSPPSATPAAAAAAAGQSADAEKKILQAQIDEQQRREQNPLSLRFPSYTPVPPTSSSTALVHLPAPAYTAPSPQFQQSSLMLRPPLPAPQPLLPMARPPPFPPPGPANIYVMERKGGLVSRAVDLLIDVCDEIVGGGPGGPPDVVCVHGILHSVNHVWCPCCPYIPHNLA